MALVTTPAVVLRAYRYSETSKVVRLATRDLGVQSALAKGALRPKSRFQAGLELLSEGTAQLYYRETRELQILAAFDLEDLRRGLAADVARFAGAAALAEVMLKLAPPAPLPTAYDSFTASLAILSGAAGADVEAAAIRALWELIGVLGYEPSLRACVRDGTPIAAGGEPVCFSTAEGGVLCAACVRASLPAAVTRLPAPAYRDLVALCETAGPLPELDAPHAAAHRRLVARWARHHLETAASGLPAIEFWERRAWAANTAS